MRHAFIPAVIVAALSLAALPANAQARRNDGGERGGDHASGQAVRRQGPAEGERRQGEQRAAPRGEQGRPYSYQRPADRDRGPAYRGDDHRGEHRGYAGPRGRYSYPARPYSVRPYVRPYGYVPYHPYRFSRPYYSFRPHLNIGFGLWLGDPVPYPYAYMGDYRPRVYGYYSGGGPYYSVTPGRSIYGGVSFDIQPADADVYVDGQFVGAIGEFGPDSEPLTMTPGTHHIEVQRDGYEPRAWDVTVQPGQVIPYRGDMQAY